MTLQDYIKNNCTDNRGIVVAKREFAAKLKVSESALVHWCNGTRTPTLKKVKEIENLTNGMVSFNDFINEKPEPVDESLV